MLIMCHYSKSERKITYEQFEVAVGLLAEKKYPGVANGLERIRVKLTSGSGPSTHGATVSLLGLQDSHELNMEK